MEFHPDHVNTTFSKLLNTTGVPRRKRSLSHSETTDQIKESAAQPLHKLSTAPQPQVSPSSAPKDSSRRFSRLRGLSLKSRSKHGRSPSSTPASTNTTTQTPVTRSSIRLKPPQHQTDAMSQQSNPRSTNAGFNSSTEPSGTTSTTSTQGTNITSSDPTTDPNAKPTSKIAGDMKGMAQGIQGSAQTMFGAVTGSAKHKEQGMEKMNAEDQRLGAKSGVPPVGADTRGNV